MKRRIHIWAALLLMLVMLTSIVSAGAVSQTRNGLTVEVRTNKEVYAADEQIQGTVKVHNANNYELAVAYELVLPEQLEATAKDKGVLLLEADEVTSGGFTVQMAQRGADALPVTGDDFPMEMIGVLLAVSLVMMVVLCPKKQTMSFLLVLMLVAQMGAPVLISSAAAEAVYPEDAWQQVFEDEKTEEEMELIWDNAELANLDRAALEDPDEDAVLDTFVLEQRVAIDGQLMTIYVKVTVSSGESLAGLKNTLGSVSLKSVKILGRTKFRLEWSKVAGATHYEVWHSTGSGYVKRATMIGTAWTTNYGVAGVINTYKVRAITKTGNTITAKGPYATRTCYGMDTPVNPTVAYAASTGTDVRISWQKGSFCTGYYIFRSLTGETGTYKNIGSSTSLSFIDKYHNGYYKIRPYYTSPQTGITYSGPATDTCNMVDPFDIITQPANMEVAEGQKASATVEAVGKNLAYQWYFADVGDAAFRRSSITRPTYSLTMTSATHGRRLYCVVTDAYGRQRTTKKVTMSLAAKPLEIIEQPQSMMVAAGQKASATVVASGNGLTYQWYFADVGATNFRLSTIKKATYSMTMTEELSGRRLYCVVSDMYGNSVTTDTVTLSVEAPFTYTITDNKCTITGYLGTDTAIVVPDTIAGTPVVAIAENAFANNTSMTAIVLPESLTAVGASAFKGCTALATMTLPGGMTVVEESTFEGCTSLTSVTLPNGITTIGKRAFYGCTSLSEMETFN